MILGFDMLGVANPEHMKFASPDRTTAVINNTAISTPTIDVDSGTRTDGWTTGAA